MPIPGNEIARLLARLARELSGVECDRCGAVSMSTPCSTCEAMAYARGDAFTRLCCECERGFVTADPNRDLCCFCMKRDGENYGRNRRADPQASRYSERATRAGTSGTPAWTREPGASGALKNTSIRTGEIIAWRVWVVTAATGELRLRSMAVDCIWEPGEGVSVNSVLEQCGYSDGWERIPPGVGAGIHAFKEPNEAVRQYPLGTRRVFGTVALWGEVIEHEMGYRAEFGRVASLDYLGSGEPEENVMLERLRKIYGVEGKIGRALATKT